MTILNKLLIYVCYTRDLLVTLSVSECRPPNRRSGTILLYQVVCSRHLLGRGIIITGCSSITM